MIYWIGIRTATATGSKVKIIKNIGIGVRGKGHIATQLGATQGSPVAADSGSVLCSTKAGALLSALECHTVSV